MSARKPRYRRWILAVVALAAIPLGLSFIRPAAVSTPTVHAATTEEAQGERPELLSVKVVTPLAGGMERSTTQPGNVRAFEYEELYAKVSGYLIKQVVDIGSIVKKGEVLAEIYAPELAKDELHAAASLEQAKSQVRQMEAHREAAKAELAAATILIEQKKAEVKRAKANLGYREKQYARIKELADARAVDLKLLDEQFDQLESAQAWRDSASAGVQTAIADVESKKAKLVQAEADIEAARANVNVADATLQKARVFVEFTKIRSHYDGAVTARNYHDGDYIRPASHSELPLFVVQRIDLMRVVVLVPDVDVPFVRKGDPVDITISALPLVKFPLYHVSRVARSQDQRSKTMRVEVDVPNDKDVLRDGMYGAVTIHFKQFQTEDKYASRNAVRVPSAALVRGSNDKVSVFVVRDKVAHQVPVVVGSDNGNIAEVLSGLNATDQVVNHPGPLLREGLTVNVIPAAVAVPRAAAAH
jgi:HlyD family secretion protein